MAFCTKCSASIDDRAISCPECGYDFSEAMSPRTEGWEFGPKGDLVLACYSFVVALAALIATLGTLVTLIGLLLSQATFENRLGAFFYCTISMVGLMGQWVILQRLQNHHSRS